MLSVLNSPWPLRVGGICCVVVYLLFYHADLYSSVSRVLGLGSSVLSIASAAHVEVVLPSDDDAWPYRRFKSSPLTPPNITITRTDGELADGYLFLNPKPRFGHAIQQAAPFIISSDNELVYGYNETDGTNDFRVQDINGRPHLTFWEGQTTIGHGYGDLVVLDEEYLNTTMDLGVDIKWLLPMYQKHPPGMMDFHEHRMTSRGSMLVTAYNNTPVDLSDYGGPSDGWISDSLFFEIDVVTNDILFSWSALDHISINDSKLPVTSYMGDGTANRPYDFFHINSMQDLGDTILINSRHTWATYLISRDDGHVIWEVSGRGGGGSFGPFVETFRWQHDALAYNVTEHSMEISLFDNHNMVEDNGTMPSRGLLLGLSLPPDPSKAPTILRDLRTPDEMYAGSQGSYDAALSNGNQLLCYGPIPVVAEFGPASNLLWEGRFGHDDSVQSYRAFKAPWHGTPRDWDPALVVELEQTLEPQHVKAYVSWNGATDVEAWNVYKGDCSEELKLVGTATARGFETVFQVDVDGASCVQVAALRLGEEIRRSNMALMPTSL